MIKKISSVAGIIAVPTFIASVYGMNFEHMPELDERWGYPMALGVMAVCRRRPHLLLPADRLALAA